MLNKYGRSLYNAGRVIAEHRRRATTLVERLGAKGLVPKEIISDAPQAFRTVLLGAFSHDTDKSMADILPSVTAQFERYAAAMEAGLTCSDMEFHARALEERFQDDLERHWFFWLDQTKVSFYNGHQLFGVPVSEKFFSANDDIEEAGKCLALERGTAAVMHLMRVMEVGLKVLAKPLGIPYAPSWESYLRQISAKMDLPYKKKSRKWRKQEAFFRDVSGDLVTVKQAWRNPSMHVVRKYTSEEAGEVFAAVRTFMQHLASGLDA